MILFRMLRNILLLDNMVFCRQLLLFRKVVFCRYFLLFRNIFLLIENYSIKSLFTSVKVTAVQVYVQLYKTNSIFTWIHFSNRYIYVKHIRTVFFKLFLYKFAHYTKKCSMITSITYKNLGDNYGI